MPQTTWVRCRTPPAGALLTAGFVEQSQGTTKVGDLQTILDIDQQTLSRALFEQLFEQLFGKEALSQEMGIGEESRTGPNTSAGMHKNMLHDQLTRWWFKSMQVTLIHTVEALGDVQGGHPLVMEAPAPR